MRLTLCLTVLAALLLLADVAVACHAAACERPVVSFVLGALAGRLFWPRLPPPAWRVMA